MNLKSDVKYFIKKTILPVINYFDIVTERQKNKQPSNVNEIKKWKVSLKQKYLYSNSLSSDIYWSVMFLYSFHFI